MRACGSNGGTTNLERRSYQVFILGLLSRSICLLLPILINNGHVVFVVIQFTTFGGCAQDRQQSGKPGRKCAFCVLRMIHFFDTTELFYIWTEYQAQGLWSRCHCFVVYTCYFEVIFTLIQRLNRSLLFTVSFFFIAFYWWLPWQTYSKWRQLR